MLYYESKSVTDVGNKRTVNQDSYIEMRNFFNDKYIGLFCVADGMGGLADGEYASTLATSMSTEWYRNNLEIISKKKINENHLKRDLKELFFSINEKIYLYGKEKNIKVGTTYSLLLLVDNKYYVVHAGDSRIYMKRKDKLFMLTKDQTWVNDQVEKGLMSPEQALHHPKKNVLANCMGCFENPSICMGNGKVELNDTFLLCSDGLYNLMTIDEISRGMSCENLDYISAEMLSTVKDRGGFDNITMLIVKAISPLSIEATTVDLR